MSEITYQSTKEGLINQLFQLQQLQEEGVSTGALAEETEQRLFDLIETSDKEKLLELRDELNLIATRLEMDFVSRKARQWPTMKEPETFG